MTVPPPRPELRPATRIPADAGYGVPRSPRPIDLRLDGNEGRAPDPGLLEAVLAAGPGLIQRYPDARPLQELLAGHHGVTPEEVVVTAGGDEALERLCRAVLEPGRELILPVPTFEMIARYAQLAGGSVVGVDWPEEGWPVDAVLERVGDRTAMIAVIAPNNPTGQAVPAEVLRRLAVAAPHALLLLDLAYAEFADEDLMPIARSLPNAVVVRTFSKAWGLAGLRVGYAVGPAEILRWMRVAGGPYNVASLSLAAAAERLRTGGPAMRRYVARARAERERLAEVLGSLGARPLPSHANFVFARVDDPIALRDALAGRGIGIRAFPGRPGLEDAVRITCPGDVRDFERLCAALCAVMPTEARR